MGISSIIKPSNSDKAPEGAAADDTEVLDEEPRNMLLSIISQLRIGMDLSKITLPVFVLEPRSMLERVTDFHAHPELMKNVGEIETAEERFIAVLRYYLAGWHTKPKGVKKPYNPVLGEFFRCRYDYPDGTVAYYVAEQVSHHPPISAWYYSSPENNLEICGEVKPKSKFLGNSAATIMEGASHAMFLNRPEDGEYNITMPNIYARGILFGKMVLELGDTSLVKCESQNLTCDLEFKTKGFFSGSYNAIAGKVKGPKGQDIAEISGKWNSIMEIQRKGKGKEVLFDANCKDLTNKRVAPEEKQSLNESRRLWSGVTAAINANDLDAATAAKSIVEDSQRESTKARDESGKKWSSRFFAIKDGEHRPNFSLPRASVEDQLLALREFVYGEDFEPEFTNRSNSSPTTTSTSTSATTT